HGLSHPPSMPDAYATMWLHTAVRDNFEALKRLLHGGFEVGLAVLDAHEPALARRDVPRHVDEHLERLRHGRALAIRLEAIAPLRHVLAEVRDDEREFAALVGDDDSRFRRPAHGPVLVRALEPRADCRTGRAADPLGAAGFRA